MMPAAKIFLAVVGVAYIALALWCALKPGQTSNAIGFQLKPGNGQSEYFTVYGGLQLGLALVFLWPFVQADTLSFVVTACMVIHGCLVLMRSVSFGVFSGIPAMTIGFAVSEWVIFLAAAYFWWQGSPSTTMP